MENIYNAIEPEYALFPQADCKSSQFYHGCYRDVLVQLSLAGVSQSKTYFMSRYTHAMTIARDGTITVEKLPIRGTDPGYEDYLAAFEPYN
ncbi:MAG: hypothetical protein E7385_02185 [Ruminococcaceae bacterium]|nr:hypothetical protein [Oscillospiraceae bacterium]